MGGGLLGLIAIVAVAWLARGYLDASPRKLALVLRSVLGAMGFGVGVPLMMSGRVLPGVLLCLGGAWALGWLPGALQAQLDRWAAGGGEHADADAHAGHGGTARAGAMSEQEAYEILGLQPGAGTEEIRAAHRALIKKLHPDAGGVSSLAARVNEAKDILLRGHR